MRLLPPVPLRALLGLIIAGAAAATAITGPASAARPTLPEQLSHLGDARQVVIVTAKGWHTSYAQLQTWQETSSGDWQQVMAPVPARIGWSGFRRAANRLQNTGKTPAGTFGLISGFGLARSPGVRIPYHVVNANDWWPYDPRDPKTYNVAQFHRSRHAKWRKDWAEHLHSFRTQYHFAVVLDYNLPSGIIVRNHQRIATHPANTRKGGGIFLHVNGSGATAGCVSVSRDQMRSILRWLDPADHPVIVTGPRSAITRM
jgi:L,D-peptidoglycan transpeptidase YkuD (ErfK/YbiS/YcfS/YnhG family)